jgi:pimeloyl-ACP methyl ester carboxylesterase
MSIVKVNGTGLNVVRLGQGERTVVFLHGLVMDNLSSWYYTIANPVARDSDVVLYDLRGHGLSERPATGYTVEDGIADLCGLLDTLGIHRPVYLAGNSYGGLLAIAFARAHPERVAGLILVEAHFPITGWGEQVADTLEVAGLWMDEPRVLSWLQENDKRHHKRRFKNGCDLLRNTTLMHDLRGVPPLSEVDLKDIQAPALAVYGEHSDVVDRGYELERWLPRCRLEILKGAQHTILMERTPEVREHIIEWLRTQPPRSC